MYVKVAEGRQTSGLRLVLTSAKTGWTCLHRFTFPSQRKLAYNAAMERSPVTVENVRNLQENRKRVLEDILGQKLKENQQVFIMAFTPGTVPTEKDRQEALAGLKETWEKVDRHMKKHGVTGEEFDAAVDEAVKQVRHRQD
jgi:hypothetical protein